MARLIIVDPALRGYGGHHYNCNLAIVEQAARHGMEFATLAHTELADPNIISILQAVPVFEYDQYRVPTMEGPLHAFGADDPIRDVTMRPFLSARLNRYYFETLSKILTPVVSPGDVVVFHSVTANLVTAAARWLAENSRRVGFRTIFFMIAADYETLDGSRVWQTDVYEGFLKQLAEVGPERVYVSAETSEMAADLTRLSGGTVAVGESPHLKPISLLERYLSQPARERGPGSGCIAGYMGETRFERGAHLIPGIVDRLADLLPERLRFIVQVNYSALDLIRQGLAEDARKAYSRRGITVVDRRLPVDGYYAHLKTPDLIMLPYTERYTKSGSGIFWETFAMGKAMVVPRDSLMARLNTGCATFDEPTEDAVADAVRRIIDDLPAVAAVAREAGRQWQREHDPAAFFDRYFGGNA